MIDSTSEFDALQERALICTQCGLAETRTSVVFGVGDQSARLMIVGEAPGKYEDLQGEPFVGAAGALLDELLADIDVTRPGVYIANVLKCRPPANRDPRPDEIEACKPYLQDQIRMIEPEVVMTLGNFATKLLLRTETGITRLRGQRYDWWLGATLIPTFHPAAALRGGEKVKDLMREDFELVRQTLSALTERGPEERTSSEGASTDQMELFR